MFTWIQNLFSTSSARTLDRLQPIVADINAQYEQLAKLSNDDLRQRTQHLKQKLHNQQAATKQKINELVKKATESDNPEQQRTILHKIDKLRKKHHQHIQRTLDKMLPQAFAILKETARRFKENTTLTVTATPYDEHLASQHAHITLEDKKAIWHNTWDVMGTPTTWDMVHYDVQLLGAISLHQGKIAEMQTGEGKTLTSTSPIFLNALTGQGVHIVTVNNYLAQRDAAWMGPLFQFHGLTVACIDPIPAGTPARKQAYRAEITYGTTSEFGFDYLRDNMAAINGLIVQRKPYYAIVDEIDSVLIDEARTPLIISSPADVRTDHIYANLKPRVQQLYQQQRQLVQKYLKEAEKQLAKKDKTAAGLALFRAYRGLPTYPELIDYLSQPGHRALLKQTEDHYLQDNAVLMPEADAPLFFTIDEKLNHIELTDKGITHLTRASEDPHLFVLPDLDKVISAIDREPAFSSAQKQGAKAKIRKVHTQKAQILHAIQQLLKAYTQYRKNIDYIVTHKKVKLIDTKTGRIMEGRRYSDELHQAIEAKENVPIQPSTQTAATITLQNYFRMYPKLAGMTGTAATDAREFSDIYGLKVVTIPTHKPNIRKDGTDKVYKTIQAKEYAILKAIQELHARQRPILCITSSVQNSERLSKLLTHNKLPHEVLNAKNHLKEAAIIAQAGTLGAITIATNMAGRGTDIKPTPEVKEKGGLAVILAERHPESRIDLQAQGRTARQGDPGTTVAYLSLQDDLLRQDGSSDTMIQRMEYLGMQDDDVLEGDILTSAIKNVQQKMKENNFSHRKRILEYDNVLEAHRNVIYSRRKHARSGKLLQTDIAQMQYQIAEKFVQDAHPKKDYANFTRNLQYTLGLTTAITSKTFHSKTAAQLTDKLYKEIHKYYQQKRKAIQDKFINALTQDPDNVPDTLYLFNQPVRIDRANTPEANAEQYLQAIERTISLTYIDKAWESHLQFMDELRQFTSNASYEQKDPLLMYKIKAFEPFKNLIHSINLSTIAHLCNLNPDHIEAKSPHEATQGDDAPRQVPTQQKINRNQLVSVRYKDGTIKKEVKFKTIAEDLAAQHCKIINTATPSLKDK